MLLKYKHNIDIRLERLKYYSFCLKYFSSVMNICESIFTNVEY
jgi:hypothetical protein